jgi:putative nucleotidyltransferase with HDIG domain
MRLVSISMIKPDMVLAKSIYYRDCLVLKVGQKDIGRFAGNLKNMGIDYIYVEDSKSDGIEIPDAISEETRTSCKRVLRQTIENFASKTVVDITEMSASINNVIDEILNNGDIQISLNDIGAADEYTFTHSVSTTVYALLIAQKLGYSRPMLEKLAAGCLLHDIGKIFLDKKILNKEGILDNDEIEHIKKHTTLGYEALKKCVSLTELSRIISLYHHERMDGTGYPTGTPAGDLHEFNRIVAIADVYDALTTDRVYRKKWSANQAVNYLIEFAETKFDIKLVSVFIKQIAIYPNGSMVRLSNQSIGIVKKQNRSTPLRPIIRIIKDEQGNEIEPYEMDMMEELSVTIVESELELLEYGSGK